MAHKAKNKMKYWRRAVEVEMMPQEVEVKGEDGEIKKQIVQVPYILSGRQLRDSKVMYQSKPLPSNLMFNLMVNGGYVKLVNEEVTEPEPLTNEAALETN
jgi:hypothetical protein